MSRLYKWLSIEGRFKISARYAMNYSFFLFYLLFRCTVVDLSSEQPLSPDVNHWSLGML